MLFKPSHESIRREMLTALDAEISTLKKLIAATEVATEALNERARQLNELHDLRHARLDLLDNEASNKPYNMTEPSATWGIPD